MRLSDLRNAKVCTVDGKVLGRIHEVHCTKRKITALTCGAGSFIESLTAKKHGRRIPWECVQQVTHQKVIVESDPPQRIVKSTGSRNQRRTRRASDRPSKR